MAAVAGEAGAVMVGPEAPDRVVLAQAALNRFMRAVAGKGLAA